MADGHRVSAKERLTTGDGLLNQLVIASNGRILMQAEHVTSSLKCGIRIARCVGSFESSLQMLKLFIKNVQRPCDAVCGAWGGQTILDSGIGHATVDSSGYRILNMPAKLREDQGSREGGLFARSRTSCPLTSVLVCQLMMSSAIAHEAVATTCFRLCWPLSESLHPEKDGPNAKKDE